MFVRNSLILLSALTFASCIDVHHRMEKKYNRDKEVELVNILHRSANDSVASWIDAGLDYTGGLLFNEWKVDICFVFNKDKTKAIGSLLNQSVNDATIDDIVIFYCEKRSGEWYLYFGRFTMGRLACRT